MNIHDTGLLNRSGTIVSPEPDTTPTLRPRHGNDACSKSTKV